MTTHVIFNENCLDTMARMERDGERVNVILTSPPYNTARCVATEHAREIHDQRYDMHFDNMTDGEYHAWTKALFEHFGRILERDGVVLYNLSYGSDNPNAMWEALEAVRETEFMIADTIIWHKNSALPNNSSPNKLTRITEFVFVICRKTEYGTYQANKRVTSVNARGQKYYENVFNYVKAPNNDGSCKLNKATFSSDLVLRLLTIYARPTDSVYDPFMGTGTTVVGCMRLNGGDNTIRCTGSEISPAQVAYAEERIASFTPERAAEMDRRARRKADAEDHTLFAEEGEGKS